MRLKWISILCLVFFALVSCTQKPNEDVAKVQIQAPQKALLFPADETAQIYPEGFEVCYAVNLTLPGKPESLVSCLSHPRLDLFTNFVADGDIIELEVPMGVDRTIDLYAMLLEPGVESCPAWIPEEMDYSQIYQVARNPGFDVLEPEVEVILEASFPGLENHLQQTLGLAHCDEGATDEDPADTVIDEDGTPALQLSYNGGGFEESDSNDGSMGNFLSIFLTGDTLTGEVGEDLITDGKAIVTNVPSGLTAVLQKVGEGQLEFRLDGNADSHTILDEVDDLTVVLLDGAFVNTAAASSVEGFSRTDLTIDFIDPMLTYDLSAFIEDSVNDGSISNSIVVTLSGDTLTGVDLEELIAEGKADISNAPSGLVPTVVRDSETQVTISLTGSASSHLDSDDISDLQVSFLDSAFNNYSASLITNSDRSDIVVNFDDPPEISYVTTTFVESSANDGTITTSTTISLTGDTFTGVAGDDMIGGSHVTVTNVPSGLNPVVTQASSNTATLSFSGSAASHTNSDDVSNVTVDFLDAAFANFVASSISGSQRSDLEIDFDDPVYLSYATGTFSEAAANDGTISTTSTVTLFNDSFSGTVSEDFIATSKVVATNVPSGLTPVLNMDSASQLTLSFSGSASVHENSDDVSNVTLTFQDTAFSSTAAANVGDYNKSDIQIDFNDAPQLIYGSTTFTEAFSHDGSISNSIVINLVGETFTGTNGPFSGSNFTVTNLPAGLTLNANRDSATQLSLSIIGVASGHDDANDVSNLTVEFTDSAFTSSVAAAVTDYNKSDLMIDFMDSPVLSYSGSTLFEGATNTGTVSNSFNIDLMNDTFTGINGDNFEADGKITASNVPAGMTLVATRTNATQLTISLSGTATSHTDADDISNLGIQFNNTAFATSTTASVVFDYYKTDISVNFNDPPALVYSGLALSEAALNDGSVDTTITITLTGEVFTGTNGEDYVVTSKVAVSNLPAGLTGVVTKDNNSQLTLSITGAATNHTTGYDVSNVTVIFQDTAFTSAPASVVLDSNRSDIALSFSN